MYPASWVKDFQGICSCNSLLRAHHPQALAVLIKGRLVTIVACNTESEKSIVETLLCLTCPHLPSVTRSRALSCPVYTAGCYMPHCVTTAAPVSYISTGMPGSMLSQHPTGLCVINNCHDSHKICGSNKVSCVQHSMPRQPQAVQTLSHMLSILHGRLTGTYIWVSPPPSQ